MEHIVYSPGKSEYRYGSGMTLYSEAFRNGRLLALEFHAVGMPQNTGDRVKGEDLSAFRLEIDGQDMTYDWTLLKREKRTAPDGRPFGTLALKHDRLPVELTITTFCGNNGYYTRKMSIRNASDRMLSITRVSPLCGALWEMLMNPRRRRRRRVAFHRGSGALGMRGVSRFRCWIPALD